MKTMILARNAAMAGLAAALLALGACSEKRLYTHDELYNAQIALRADWQGLEPTAEELEVRIESLTEGVEQDETIGLPATGSVPVVLHEARYRFTASHEAANTVFDGTRFSLTPDADGLLPEPGRLSAFRLEQEVGAQDVSTLTLPLRRLTHELTLRFKLEENQVEGVRGMKVRIGGMARSVDIGGQVSTDLPGASIALTLQAEAVEADGTEGGAVYGGSYRVLGVHGGERQTMDITIDLADGTQFTTATDISADLLKLNSQPELTLNYRLEYAGLPGSDVGFNILPWDGVLVDGDGDAGMEIPGNEE